ncbi:MAG: GGDEF domain-containing protein [Treponema sp.]|nr:GGDEF domain-containing protein [Treponema sp.]
MTEKKIFTLLICFSQAAMISDFAFAVVNGIPADTLRIVNWIVCTTYFLLMTISFSAIILLFEHTLNGDSISFKKMFRKIIFFNAIYAALLISNFFTHSLFYITADNIYERGPLYLITFSIPNVLLLLLLFYVYKNRKLINHSLFILAMVATLPIAAGGLFDIIWQQSSVTWPGVFISLLFFYLFIIRKATRIDPLTTVYNRRGFDEYVLSIPVSSRHKKYAFIMIDMDRFKDINDQFGHSQGDNALRDAAEILRASVRRSDIVARYGGDEFVVIATSGSAEIIIRNIKSGFHCFNAKKIRPYTLELSCGGDIYHEDDPRTPSEFLTYVDSLMYSEKERRQG